MSSKTIPSVLSALKTSADSLIPLSSERYYGGTHAGNPWWVKLNLGNHCVEGILHANTHNYASKLLIFEPGYPGDGSTRLERLHIRKLLESGFTVFAARHNATIINGKHSQNYINCVEKQERAKSEGQELLGNNRDGSIADWLYEPLVSVSLLANSFQDVYLMGHSFGVLAILNSLIKLMEAKFEGFHKIIRVISLSGATGRVREPDDPILIQWKEHLDTDSARERIRIGNPEQNIEILRNAYELIHTRATSIPENIDIVHISPWGDNLNNLDELVSPLQALDFIASLGRGSLVIDKTQHSDRNGRMVHDMDNLKTEDLLNFLDGKLMSIDNHLGILK